MVPLSNLAITSWLLLAICAGFSAHAYTGHQYDYSPVSLDERNERQISNDDFPPNEQLRRYSNSGGHDSVASTPSPISAPPRSSSSQSEGWKPIIRTQTTNEYDRFAQIQPRLDFVNRERAGSPRQSRTTYQGYGRPKQLPFQRYDTLKVDRTSAKPPQDEPRFAFQYPPKRKDAPVLNENDIMWMQYGPQVGRQRHQQVQKVHQSSQYTPPASKFGQRSYEVEESDEYSEDAEPPPQNIYQVIDRSTSPTLRAQVASLVKRQTTETWLADESSSENSVQTYKFGFDSHLIQKPLQDRSEKAADSAQLGNDDQLDGFGVADLTHQSSNTKYASRNIGGFVNFAATTSTPIDDESLNTVESFEQLPNRIIDEISEASAIPIKSGQLLDNPIVIMEPQTTTLTPEYYRQLFDSFSSGHYRQVDTDSPPTNKKNLLHKESRLPASSTATTATPLVSVATEKYTESPVVKQSVAGMTKQNETEKSNSVFFTIPNHQLVDLLPETLKMNWVAVKRVLIDCYKPSDKGNKSSSVNCFKKITFDILDKAIESDVVKLTDTVSLVKDNRTSSWQGRSATSRSLDRTEWLPNIIERVQQLFSTHALKVKLLNSQESDGNQVEGRRRYRHNFRRVFPVVASIYMIVTSVLMPLVFQFMAVMAGKSFMVGKIALLFALLTSFNKFLSIGIDNILPWYLQPGYASPSPPPPPPSPPLLPLPYPVPYPHYGHQKKDNRKKDTDMYDYSYTTKRRRRHYRRVFPIMVGAYMILSSLLIPLGFKFMVLLGMKSILISSFSFMMAIMGGAKKYMGSSGGSSHSSYYPSPYPSFYPSYYDPWRREEYKKISNGYDYPMEFSHFTEEVE